MMDIEDYPFQDSIVVKVDPEDRTKYKYIFNEKVTAIGPCGLDYHPKTLLNNEKVVQHLVLPLHYKWAEKYKKPMFFEGRMAEDDLIKSIRENRHRMPKGGVVHHFTGSYEQMKQILDLGLYIGVSGCSLRTPENCEVIKKLPLNRIILGTNSPHGMMNESYHGIKYVES